MENKTAKKTENKNTKITNFYPESRDMIIIGKSLCQKWSNSIDIAIILEMLVQTQQNCIFR